ncbi:hypothetical protein FZI85_26760 [Mycobacterium sp. CBMA293]|uniref:hypothetical protein n=1 Tax=unclassified Mycolicibacterium TaxID=2636767 RepID=UPI0012DC079E|nr:MULTISPECIES: hypothetical protein [unclassified Mycolicibacterium]MUL48610.1 hypothetical protein [Mycolicibacterium sp. CBMA 360]MUL62067.1 hypothetical protein [Mycolicibacterium sp. CBMA 335]MUL73342.1 hypothetical protein [Mycolicibacterium sp. CBMA 311]MUL96511.1 hypothetical protein [Mycolicibacterium sp. CBMA 230]MUM14609.1 hypothetical protein [Mycolicibacterium sp. CBMA 293]
MSRQDRLNWQIRVAENDMTPTQQMSLASLIEADGSGFDYITREAWDRQLTGLTMVSDGYIPFRDNIDVAAAAGVSCVVEPGGSTHRPRTPGLRRTRNHAGTHQYTAVPPLTLRADRGSLVSST